MNIDPRMEIARNMAMQKKAAEEETKTRMFMNWLKNQFTQQPVQPPPQQRTTTRPAGGYTNKRNTTKYLDEAGDY